MSRILILLTICTCAVLAIPSAVSQPPAKIQSQPSKAPTQPKLVPVAETRLLMEGLALANFRGMERLLQEQPTDVKAWTFARGQALLIAETANLLMLRPPKSQGQTLWFDRSVELRNTAQQLAKTLATQDYAQSRAGLGKLAIACNHCHQAFRVPVEIAAFTGKDIEP